MQITHTQLLNGSKKVRFSDLKKGELFYSNLTGYEDRGLLLFVKLEPFYEDADDEMPLNTAPVGWELNNHVNTEEHDLVYPVNSVEVF